MVSCGFLYVTFESPKSLIRNIDVTRHAFPGATVVVVDNSHSDTSETQNDIDPAITYVRSDINNRFHAYNLGLKSINTEWLLFRTDDDRFDETVTHKLINTHPNCDIITTDYIYDGSLQEGNEMHRPLESIIFKSYVIKDTLGFGLTSGSDWSLLASLGVHYKRIHSTDVILHKRRHGR